MKHIARLTFAAALALALTFTVHTRAASLDIPATDDGLPGAGPSRRADWFQKTWTQKRNGWAQRVEKDQGALVFLGDSITQGWGDNLGGLFPGVKVANRGISGDTTRGVLIRLKEDVLDLNPASVVLLIGTNDLEEKADPETIAGNLKLILAELKKHNAKMPVVLCQVFPSSASKTRPADKIKKVNQLYAAAVKGDAQVTLMETYVLFADAQGDAKKDEFPDLLHPNKAGYAKWAGAIRPVLETLGLAKVEPDTFTPEPGFVSLFNGKDLTGWGYKTNNFDGQTASSEGRYVAKNGRLIVTTPPDYRSIRQPQLQCRDYLLAGPYTNLTQYKAGDWNEMIVAVTNNVGYCTCNGEVLEAAFKVPATGGIGLEGDRGQMEYRRIRLQELP